jgi:hypothetical protein
MTKNLLIKLDNTSSRPIPEASVCLRDVNISTIYTGHSSVRSERDAARAVAAGQAVAGRARPIG